MDKILQSWKTNASKWIEAITNGEIESRALATNAAITNMILKYAPGHILDLGCGEGWLTRELIAHGIDSTGVDGTEALIRFAQNAGDGHFFTLTYQDIIAGVSIPGQPFGAIVINFGLFEDDGTRDLLAALHARIHLRGHLFIQTVHPFAQVSEGRYQSRWIQDSWRGLHARFSDPHPWYARTMSDWINLFSVLRFRVIEMAEPLDPGKGVPLSVIFVLSPEEP